MAHILHQRLIWAPLIGLALAVNCLIGCAVPDRTREQQVTAQVRELDRLATRYYRQGRLDDAILYAREIVTRVENAVGPNDIHLAQPLNNLAVLYEAAGKNGDAEALYQQVLGILTDKLGPEHVRTALNRARLGAFYLRTSRPAQARPYYEQSLRDLEHRLNPNHPLLADPLSGLAGVMLALDKPQEAWALLERARTILEKAGSKEALRLAAVLQSESGIKVNQGEYAEAERLLKKATAVIDESLGPEHAMAREVRVRLARVLLHQHESARAAELLAQSLENIQRPTERAAAMYTLNTRRAFVTTVQNDLNLYLQLILQNKKITTNDAAQAYTLWLKYNDLDLKIQPAFQAAFLAKGCADAVEPYQSYVHAALDLARTDMAAPNPEEISGYKKGRDQQIQQRDKLKGDLITKCPAFSAQTSQDTAGADQVMTALKPDEIVIEYARLESIARKAKDGLIENIPGRYAAFVVTFNSIQLLDLGPVQAGNGIVSEIKRRCQSNDCQKRSLEDCSLKSVDPFLDRKTKIYLAPLDTFPLESVCGGSTAIRFIPSGAVLAGKNTARPASGQDLFFIDPDFNATEESRTRILQKLNITSPVQPDGKRGKGMWGFQLPPISESKSSLLDEDAKTSNALVFKAETALEDILRTQNNPPQTLVIRTRCLGKPSDSSTNNPLRDYALALAGANCTLSDPDLTHSPNILTAEEIILTNLTGTNVTLISDCQTDRSGETARILRRAFFRAGVRKLEIRQNDLY